MGQGIFDEEQIIFSNLQARSAPTSPTTLAFKLSAKERDRSCPPRNRQRRAFSALSERSLFLEQRTIKDFQQSIEFFEQARNADPNYALAYVGLADSYQLLTEYGGMPVPEAFNRAREAAAKAIELDPNSGEAHTSLAYTLAFHDWRWQEAERDSGKPQTYPNYATRGRGIANIWWLSYDCRKPHLN